MRNPESRVAPLERRFIPSLPTLDPRWLAPTFAPPRAARFPLDRLRAIGRAGRDDTHLFYLARAGVYHAVRHFLDGAPGTVLMPSYHHGVEVEAVRVAGADVEFYRVDEAMRIDLDDLRRRATAPSGRSPVRLVYLTHFVGFAQPAFEVKQLCRELGLWLFEDCALALLSSCEDGTPLGATGDAAVFCLYKTLPVPHGGVLVAPELPRPSCAAPPLPSTLHHLAGLALAHLELTTPELGRTLRTLGRAAAHTTVDAVIDYVQTGTMHLAPVELGLGASWWVERILPRIDPEMVVVRRRRNFQRLAAALDGVAVVIGAPLAGGVCPLFVPILVEDKVRAMHGLHARGVDAVDFWSGGDPACELARFPEVAHLRRCVLELPCHQSLDDDAIDFVARAVKQVLAHA